MIELVFEKINTEKAENGENAYIQVIGDFLINLVKENPQHAGKIMETSKSIKGSLEFMKSKAKAVEKNGMAMFTPDEGYKIIKEYFGITEAPELKLVRKHVDINLDDLL